MAADISQTDGIMNITEDLKLLGFRKKPHMATCRQKSYELSKTACFWSTFNSNKQETFNSSFNNCYNEHKSDIAKHNIHSIFPDSNY